jgi:hypothetical protein
VVELSIVSLQAAGLLYEDSFDSTSLDSRLEIVPNDTGRWSLTEVSGSLRLKHGATPLYVFFEELTSIPQFVLDVKNVYNPTEAGDVGGVIVYANDDDFISLDEYFNTALGTTQTYPWLRVVRDYNTYYAYWSNDGVIWNAAGSQAFNNEVPRVGLFLVGTSGENMDVEYVRVSTSTKIVLTSLVGGMIVDMLGSDDTVIASKTCRTNDSTVAFRADNLVFPLSGKFRVTLPGVTPTSYTSDLFSVMAGDKYKFSFDLDLYYVDDEGSDVSLGEAVEGFLGYLNSGDLGYKLVKMKVKNNFVSGTFTSTSVTAVAYRLSDAYSRLVHVASDSAGSPGTFGQTINISSEIGAGQTEVFWLKVDREFDASKIGSEVFFGLNILSSYQ